MLQVRAPAHELPWDPLVLKRQAAAKNATEFDALQLRANSLLQQSPPRGKLAQVPANLILS